MTAVIGGLPPAGYRRCMARQDAAASVAAVLQRPDEGFLAALADARAAASSQSVEASRQLEVFAGRIGDLALDELRELYDETFAQPATAGVVPRARQVASAVPRGAALREDIGVLAAAIDRLDADRNPFAYAARALCCLLLLGVSVPAALR
jgi:nitrate reductase assembly molybdenum cofactor insertion protein NarJ